MNFSVLNKLAFIANLAFILAIMMRFFPVAQGTRVESMILVTGLVISPLVNLVVNFYNAFLFFKGTRPFSHFVQVFNASVFGCQIIIYLFFSGWLPLNNIIS
jgi:hypothetical protein